MRLGRRWRAVLVLAAWSFLAVQPACASDPASTPVPGPGDVPLHPTEIHQPDALTHITTGDGASIACPTCHSQHETTGLPETAEDLGGPHVGLEVDHGEQACAACHDPTRGDRLHLADGTQVEMAEAMQLCEQCHGPQTRDYRRGSHGGMRGYWDLRRGPRTRNHCVDCHDPHAPQFPTYRPRPAPRDRFTGGHGGHDE